MALSGRMVPFAGSHSETKDHPKRHVIPSLESDTGKHSHALQEGLGPLETNAAPTHGHQLSRSGTILFLIILKYTKERLSLIDFNFRSRQI